MSRGARPFSLVHGDMDAETRQRFDRLESKFDEVAAEMRVRFHGERGDNGVYGRLQTLEEQAKAREKAEEAQMMRERWLWSLASSSGAVGLFGGAVAAWKMLWGKA